MHPLFNIGISYLIECLYKFVMLAIFMILYDVITLNWHVMSLFIVARCPICMMDFAIGEPIRLLPCMHFYHVHCIDDWLLRSIHCPTCMESVDSGVMESMRSRSHSSSQSTTPLSSGQQTPICVPSTPLTPPLSPAISLR